MIESWCLHMGKNETPLDQGLSFCIVIFPVVQENPPLRKKILLHTIGKKSSVQFTSIIVKRFGLFNQF